MSQEKKISPLMGIVSGIILMIFVLMPVPDELMEKTYERMEDEKAGSSAYCRKVNKDGLLKSYVDGVQERKEYQRSLTPRQERQEKRRSKKRRRYTAGY